MSGALRQMTARKRAAGGGVLPSDIAGLAGWWDAADTGTISTSGSSVTSWADKSGSGPSFDPPGAAPSTGIVTRNGLNTISFDGVDDSLQMSTGLVDLAVQPFTVAFAVKQDTKVSGCHFADLGTGGRRILCSGDSNWRIYANGSVVDSGVSADTNWHVFVAVFAGVSSVIRLDGVQIGAGDPGSSALQSWVLGKSDGGVATDVNIGELTVYDVNLNASGDVTDLEDYLSNKWAI